MPIRPENLARYPKEWQQIRLRILERARWCCEGSPDFPRCRAPHQRWGYWHEEVFQPVRKQPIIDALRVGRERIKPPFYINNTRIIEVVLTIAHLDHVPENCDPRNLRAWCQRCHLNYDAQHHARTRYNTRREGKAVRDLFEVQG